jgi:hypothetical protein
VAVAEIAALEALAAVAVAALEFGYMEAYRVAQAQQILVAAVVAVAVLLALEERLVVQAAQASSM